MRQILLLCLLLVSVLSAADVGYTEIMELEDCLEIALEYNQSLLIAKTEQDKANAQYTEAYSVAMPKITFNASYTYIVNPPVMKLDLPAGVMGPDPVYMEMPAAYNNNYNAGLTLTQPIYLGGRVGTALKVAKIYANYTNEAYRGTKQEVIYQTQVLFYTTLLSKSVWEVTEEGLEQVEAHYENVLNFYENGLASEYDLLRTRVAVGNVRPQVVQAKNDYIMSLSALKNHLGIPLDDLVELDGNFDYQNYTDTRELQECMGIASKKRSALLQLEHHTHLLEQNVKINSANNKPTLVLIAGWSGSGISNDPNFHLRPDDWQENYNITLALSVPIFDGFYTHSKVQQAKADLDKIHYSQKQAKRGISLELKSILQDLEEAEILLETADLIIEQAEKGYSIAKVRYEEGLGTELEIQDAQTALLQAKLNRILALYQHTMAKLKLHYAMGLVE